MVLLTWLYPWFIINLVLFAVFWQNRDLMKKDKKNFKLVWRETLGEIRYLAPFYNWLLMASLIKGRIIIDSYLKGKLSKINKI